MTQRHIGLIGFGAIGRDVVSCLSRSDDPPRFTVLRRQAYYGAGVGGALMNVDDISSLIAREPDLVVEAAGHDALERLAPMVLRAGISIVAASAGSLVQSDGHVTLAQRLRACGAEFGARLIVPSGAIGGLDYLAAIAPLADVGIVYTSRKPPAAWREELDALGLTREAASREIVLFEGSVEEAAKLYPRNLNVAATIALLLKPGDRLSVRVVVDAGASGNMHEIDIESPAGRARFEFCNAPSPANPKTSLVTALSVVQSVNAFYETRSASQ